MPDRTDAELVAAIRGGDTAAWGPVFDRHREAVWRTALAITRNPSEAEDALSAAFLRGVESIDQLRDDSNLRAWLLSITRRQALDRVRPSRNRERLSEDLGLYDAGGDGEDGDLSAGMSRIETQQLVRDALDGLEPRDRAALELGDGQELSGEELALSLGVNRDNAYAIVHNARERFTAAVSALLVARRGRDECPELDRVLEGWDGRLDPLVRKRVARHLRSCEVCDATRARTTAPSALLSAAPVTLLPAAFAGTAREQTLASAAAGATGASAVPAAAVGWTAVSKVAAAAIALAIAGTTAWVTTRSPDGADAAETMEAVETSETVAPAASPPSTSTSSAAAPQPTEASDGAAAVDVPLSTAPLAPVVDRCELIEDLRATGSAGPASGDPAALTSYLHAVDEHLAKVVEALGDDAGPSVTAYAEAYHHFVAAVDAGGAEALESSDQSPLVPLREAAESELAAVCP